VAKRFDVGSRLSEPTYGLGSVIAVEDAYTRIDFDEHGIKKFLTSLARLEHSSEPAPAGARKRKRKTAARKKTTKAKTTKAKTTKAKTTKATDAAMVKAKTAVKAKQAAKAKVKTAKTKKAKETVAKSA